MSKTKQIATPTTLEDGTIVMPDTPVVRPSAKNPQIEHSIEVLEGTHTATDMTSVQGTPAFKRDPEMAEVEMNGIGLEVTRY